MSSASVIVRSKTPALSSVTMQVILKSFSVWRQAVGRSVAISDLFCLHAFRLPDSAHGKKYFKYRENIVYRILLFMEIEDIISLIVFLLG